MRRMEWLLAAALAGVVFPGEAIPQEEKGKAPAKIPGWLADIPAGLQAARKTGRPLMIVFR